VKPLDCPTCSAHVNFVTFMRAATPWRLRCGACHEPLELNKPKWLSIGIISLYVILLVGGSIVSVLVRPPFFMGLGALVIGLAACHGAAYFLMKSFKCRLGVKERSAKPHSTLSLWFDLVPAGALVLTSVIVNTVCFFHQKEMFSANGSAAASSSGLCTLVTLSVGAACLALPFLVFGLTFKATRAPSIALMACSIIHLVITTVFIGLVTDVKLTALQGIADRSEPLVQAIHKYSADKGRPPSTLHDLVPDYLPEISAPGVPACPKFDYSTGQDSETWNGNPWVLSVQVPSKLMGLDRMFYLPKQNYQGRIRKRLGKWGYFSD
jgi:hypothetical protein